MWRVEFQTQDMNIEDQMHDFFYFFSGHQPRSSIPNAAFHRGQIDPLENHQQLFIRHFQGGGSGRGVEGDLKRSFLQAFVKNPEAVAVPHQKLDAVPV